MNKRISRQGQPTVYQFQRGESEMAWRHFLEGRYCRVFTHFSAKKIVGSPLQRGVMRNPSSPSWLTTPVSFFTLVFANFLIDFISGFRQRAAEEAKAEQDKNAEESANAERDLRRTCLNARHIMSSSRYVAPEGFLRILANSWKTVEHAVVRTRQNKQRGKRKSKQETTVQKKSAVKGSG